MGRRNNTKSRASLEKITLKRKKCRIVNHKKRKKKYWMPLRRGKKKERIKIPKRKGGGKEKGRGKKKGYISVSDWNEEYKTIKDKKM